MVNEKTYLELFKVRESNGGCSVRKMSVKNIPAGDAATYEARQAERLERARLANLKRETREARALDRWENKPTVVVRKGGKIVRRINGRGEDVTAKARAKKSLTKPEEKRIEVATDAESVKNLNSYLERVVDSKAESWDIPGATPWKRTN